MNLFKSKLYCKSLFRYFMALPSWQIPSALTAYPACLNIWPIEYVSVKTVCLLPRMFLSSWARCLCTKLYFFCSLLPGTKLWRKGLDIKVDFPKTIILKTSAIITLSDFISLWSNFLECMNEIQFRTPKNIIFKSLAWIPVIKLRAKVGLAWLMFGWQCLKYSINMVSLFSKPKKEEMIMTTHCKPNDGLKYFIENNSYPYLWQQH